VCGIGIMEWSMEDGEDLSRSLALKYFYSFLFYASWLRKKDEYCHGVYGGVTS